MKFSSRDRRAILLGALAAIAVGAYFGAVKPLRRASIDLARRRGTATEYLRRYQSVVGASGDYLAAAETADARLARLLPVAFSSDAHSSVNLLLEKLDRAATGNEVRVIRVTPVPQQPAGPGLVRIGAALECESDLRGLLGLLRTLETTGKLLHVSGLHVTAVGSAADGGVEVLSFRFSVTAFALAPLLETDVQTTGG